MGHLSTDELSLEEEEEEEEERWSSFFSTSSSRFARQLFCCGRKNRTTVRGRKGENNASSSSKVTAATASTPSPERTTVLESSCDDGVIYFAGDDGSSAGAVAPDPTSHYGGDNCIPSSHEWSTSSSGRSNDSNSALAISSAGVDSPRQLQLPRFWHWHAATNKNKPTMSISKKKYIVLPKLRLWKTRALLRKMLASTRTTRLSSKNVDESKVRVTSKILGSFDYGSSSSSRVGRGCSAEEEASTATAMRSIVQDTMEEYGTEVEYVLQQQQQQQQRFNSNNSKSLDEYMSEQTQKQYGVVGAGGDDEETKTIDLADVSADDSASVDSALLAVSFDNDYAQLIFSSSQPAPPPSTREKTTSKRHLDDDDSDGDSASSRGGDDGSLGITFPHPASKAALTMQAIASRARNPRHHHHHCAGAAGQQPVWDEIHGTEEAKGGEREAFLTAHPAPIFIETKPTDWDDDDGLGWSFSQDELSAMSLCKSIDTNGDDATTFFSKNGNYKFPLEISNLCSGTNYVDEDHPYDEVDFTRPQTSSSSTTTSAQSSSLYY